MAGKKKNASKQSRPKTQKKAKRRRGRKNAGGKRGGMGNMRVAKTICSLTDPFCKAAVGSKYPDVGSLKTLAWDMESYVNIITDASGRGAYFFSPEPGSGFAPATAFSGVTNIITNTTPAAAYPGWSNWNTATGINWRCVSFGIQVSSTLSAMSNQGIIGVVAIPATGTSLPTANTDLDSNNFALNKRVSCSQNIPLSAISYNDGFISKEFKISGAGLANVISSMGNDVLVAYIVGGPATQAAVQVKVVGHYELTFGSGTVFNTIATPMAVHNDAVASGVNHVQRTVEQVIVGGVQEVEKQVEDAALSFAKYVVSSAPSAVESFLEMML